MSHGNIQIESGKAFCRSQIKLSMISIQEVFIKPLICQQLAKQLET